MKSKKNKFYTVWVGRTPGVYSSWEDCKKEVHGFEGAIYKGFVTKEEADLAFLEASHTFIGGSNITRNVGEDSSNIPAINSICVDGAWNTQTNAMEYQGVLLQSRKRIFHAGPFKVGTNNIAEFLAIVHGLVYCESNIGINTIYSDSQTAITWVKNKRAGTKIENSMSTQQVLAIVKRAEDWLKSIQYKTIIAKWETSLWGENPADFGRK